MVLLVSTYIEHFTYLGLLLVLVLCGLGLPMPEDVALLAGGFLVHRGIIQLPATLAVSFVGVIGGDCSLFFLGRRFGTGLVSHLSLLYPNYRESLGRMRAFMDRHGHRAIFYGRFLAGLRAVIYLCAGSLGVPTGRFVLYDVMGAAISVPIVVSLGFLFGDEIEALVRYLGGFDRLLIVVAVASVLIWLMRSMILARPSGSAPDGLGDHQN